VVDDVTFTGGALALARRPGWFASSMPPAWGQTCAASRIYASGGAVAIRLTLRDIEAGAIVGQRSRLLRATCVVVLAARDATDLGFDARPSTRRGRLDATAILADRVRIIGSSGGVPARWP
jgi:hypothetical protein